MKKAIVYYTDQSAPEPVMRLSWETILPNLLGWSSLNVAKMIQSKTAKRSLRQMVINILCGIAQTDADVIYFCEHDVLYPEGYFDGWDKEDGRDFTAHYPGYFLDRNGFRLRNSEPLAAFAGTRLASVDFFERQLKQHLNEGRYRSSEPSPSRYKIAHHRLSTPYIDVRHGANYTGSTRGIGKVTQEIHGWPTADKLWGMMRHEQKD